MVRKCTLKYRCSHFELRSVSGPPPEDRDGGDTGVSEILSNVLYHE